MNESSGKILTNTNPLLRVRGEEGTELTPPVATGVRRTNQIPSSSEKGAEAEDGTRGTNGRRNSRLSAVDIPEKKHREKPEETVGGIWAGPK
jgi:hypothetical protein